MLFQCQPECFCAAFPRPNKMRITDSSNDINSSRSEEKKLFISFKSFRILIWNAWWLWYPFCIKCCVGSFSTKGKLFSSVDDFWGLKWMVATIFFLSLSLSFSVSLSHSLLFISWLVNGLSALPFTVLISSRLLFLRVSSFSVLPQQAYLIKKQ